MDPLKYSIPRVLTIAGSDSGGGAGIQADLKACTCRGVYSASVITALTAQNTVGVQAIHVPPLSFIEQQLQSVFTDIGFQVVKTGMLPNASIIRAVAETIQRYKVPHVVVDPVLVATSGDSLVSGEDSMKCLVNELFPLATVVTPNLPEVSKITGRTIRSVSDMREACVDMVKMGCKNVLLKGGHMGQTDSVSSDSAYAEDIDPNVVIDILYDGKEFEAFSKPRVDSKNTHGTGCTLASAIAAELAKGHQLKDAVATAKEYVYQGIVEGLDIGRGNGPVNHINSSVTFRGM